MDSAPEEYHSYVSRTTVFLADFAFTAIGFAPAIISPSSPEEGHEPEPEIERGNETLESETVALPVPRFRKPGALTFIAREVDGEAEEEWKAGEREYEYTDEEAEDDVEETEDGEEDEGKTNFAVRAGGFDGDWEFWWRLLRG